MEQTPRTDGELLAAFLDSGQEAPFEELLRRHGRLVFNVCLRSLGDAHAAEDAAQAVFLTLSHKAAALRGRASLAGWLYHVAWHVARRAREAEALRKEREREAGVMAAQSDESTRAWAQLKPVLDDELNALPERFRLPVVLHHLEGYSEEEGAKRLGWERGTFSSRISRGRELLRERVARRGVILSAGLLATVVSAHASAAEVPAAFVTGTAKTAALVSAGHAAAGGVVSAQVAALTKGALHMLFKAQLLKAAAVLLGMTLLVTGAGITTFQLMAEEKAGPAAKEGEAPKPDQKETPALAPGENAPAAALVNGLSVTVTPAKAVFAAKDHLVFTVQLKNVSDNAFLLFDTDHWYSSHSPYRFVFLDAQTKESFTAIFGIRDERELNAADSKQLKPGEAAEVKITMKGSFAVHRKAGFSPGKYSLTLTAKFEISPLKVQWTAPHWKGEIAANAVEFEIAKEDALVAPFGKQVCSNACQANLNLHDVARPCANGDAPPASCAKFCNLAHKFCLDCAVKENSCQVCGKKLAVTKEDDQSTPAKCWEALLEALKSGEANRVKALCVAKGFESLESLRKPGDDKLKDVGERLSNVEVRWRQEGATSAEASLRVRPEPGLRPIEAEPGVEFTKVDGKWFFAHFMKGR